MLNDDTVKNITAAWIIGKSLGRGGFNMKVEKILNGRAGLVRKGRPKKLD